MIVRRGVLTDLYVEGDRSVVMVDESVLGLSPIATAILDAVPEGAAVSVQSVTDHVVATFGAPEPPQSADDLTRRQVWDLVAHNVLAVVDDGGTTNESPSRCSRRSHYECDGEHGSSVDAVRDALRHLRSDHDGRWRAPESMNSEAFVRAARQHHVVPFLAAHLDRLDLPAQATAELEAMAGRQHAGAVLLTADLSRALDVLRAAGIRALAFKGVTLAAQAYGDHLIRGAGDLDVLVPPEDIASAHSALVQADWKPAGGYPTPGPSWAWGHFVRTGNELTLTGDTSDIDLHWHLAPTRGTFPDFENLWARRAIISVAGQPIPTLSAYDALAHSAGHAAKDEWRWLRSLLDVHALMANPETWLDADRPLRSDQLRTVGLAARELGTPAGAPPIIRLAAGRIHNSALEVVRRQQRGTAAEHRSSAVPGLEFLYRLRTIERTHGSAAESARLLSRSALPPWLTAHERSPSVWRAVPRVLARKAQEVLSKGTATLRATRL